MSQIEAHHGIIGALTLHRLVVGLMPAGALAGGCGGDRTDCNCPAAPPRGCVYSGREGCACAAMVCSDVGPVVDLGSAVVDVGTDAGAVDVGGVDTPTDRGTMDVADESRRDGVSVDAPRDDA